MKKKIALILIITLLFSPFSSVFAAEAGLLQGKTLTTNGTSTSVGLITDGDITTGVKASVVGQYYEYTFDSPLTIDAYYLDGTSTQLFDISYWDDSGANLMLSRPYGNAGKVIKNVQNVKRVRVAFYGTTINANNFLDEFDVYSSTNPEPVIVSSPVTSLSETHTFNSTTLSWTNPNNNGFVGVKIKKDGVEVATLANTSSSYTINGLDPDTSYNFEILATYSDGTISGAEKITVKTDSVPADTTPAGEITNLVVAKTDTAVSLMYSLPTDTDFSHLKIYRDGVVLQGNHTASSFDDFGLAQNTTYVYKITSVDLAGNESAGVVQSITTDITQDLNAPTAVIGVNVTPGNSSGNISWDTHGENDVAGYNVYVDGVKHNTSLIKATNYTLNNLDNGLDYSITVTAVDTADNESVASVAAILTPSEALMPLFSPKYDLADVATGTASWFDSLWLLLAFSVSIPLAFLIARRVKGLFLS